MKARKLMEKMEINLAISCTLVRGLMLHGVRIMFMPISKEKGFQSTNRTSFLLWRIKIAMLARRRNTPSICERLRDISLPTVRKVFSER